MLKNAQGMQIILVFSADPSFPIKWIALRVDTMVIENAGLKDRKVSI